MPRIPNMVQFPEVRTTAFGLTSNVIPLLVGEAIELAAINAQVFAVLKLIIWIGSTRTAMPF